MPNLCATEKSRWDDAVADYNAKLAALVALKAALQSAQNAYDAGIAAANAAGVEVLAAAQAYLGCLGA